MVSGNLVKIAPCSRSGQALTTPTRNSSCDILVLATAPKGGVNMIESLISLIIAPLFVGLVLLLVDRWLDD